MITAAPTFAQIAVALGNRLDGAVLVAHNISFDVRMLSHEFDRIAAGFEPGSGVCTLAMTGSRLPVAAQRLDIPFNDHHRALSDARASAEILRAVGEFPAPTAASVAVDHVGFSPRTLRRDETGSSPEKLPYIARLSRTLEYAGVHGAELAYLDLLDWALADGVLTTQEEQELAELATDLGLTADEAHLAHIRYLDELHDAAMADGVIDELEFSLLETVAGELGVPELDITVTAADAHDSPDTLLQPGVKACFTGAATDSEGNKLTRAQLQEMTERLGLVPVKSVTKTNCDVLIAADPSSQSGKTKKAKDLGVPIVSVAEFLQSATQEGVKPEARQPQHASQPAPGPYGHGAPGGTIRTGLTEALTTDDEDDTYDLSWYTTLSHDHPTAVRQLEELLLADSTPIERHFLLTELERRLYKLRNEHPSTLNEYDIICRLHDSEIYGICEALMAKWGNVPFLELYKQQAIRQQKAGNFTEGRRWAERGIEVYGPNAAKDSWVEDLKNRVDTLDRRLATART